MISYCGKKYLKLPDNTVRLQCVKSVRIRSYSGPYFPTFGLNMERFRVFLCIQSECEKMRTRITPNTDTFYAVLGVLVVTIDDSYWCISL